MPRPLVVAVLAALTFAAAGMAASTPKPWAWTPKQAAAQVTAWNPAVFGGIDIGTLTATRCVGITKAGKGVFTGFRCATRFTPGHLSYDGPTAPTVFVKVRRQGKGQPCVSLTSLAAIPAACTNPAGTRSNPDPDKVDVALGLGLQKQLGLKYPYQGPASCAGFGAGFFVCFFGTNVDDETAGHATVIFSPTPTVSILNMPS